jgi:hypothetical protein
MLNIFKIRRDIHDRQTDSRHGLPLCVHFLNFVQNALSEVA